MKVSAFATALIMAMSYAGWGIAQTSPAVTTEAAHMDKLALSQGETKVIGKISSDFQPFLGDHTQAIVTGLRNGTEINLTTTTPGSTPEAPPVVSTTTIQPPTGKMGFGNVYISLALAKQQLSQMGIMEPTPEQLQAVLLGGTVTNGSGLTATNHEVQGILAMRNDGMGWGEIAHELGFKLGPVMSGMKSANKNLATTTTSSGGTTTAGQNGKGIVNAGGKPAGSTESGIVTGSGKALGHANKGIDGKKGIGQGIVTGSGKSAGVHGGNAYGHSKGAIVTGSGGVIGGTSGVTTGGGHAYGLQGGKGHSNSGQAKSHFK